jgi:cell division protein FtsB
MNPLMIKLIGIGGMAVLAVIGYLYVQVLQGNLELEKKNNAVLMATVESTKQTMENLRGDVQAIQNGVATMNAELAKSRADVQNLE